MTKTISNSRVIPRILFRTIVSILHSPPTRNASPEKLTNFRHVPASDFRGHCALARARSSIARHRWTRRNQCAVGRLTGWGQRRLVAGCATNGLRTQAFRSRKPGLHLSRPVNWQRRGREA